MKKQKYQVLHPISFGGRRERGEVIELTEAQAEAMGLDLIKAIAPATDETVAKVQEETVEETEKEEVETETEETVENTDETVEEKPKKGSKKGTKKN